MIELTTIQNNVNENKETQLKVSDIDRIIENLSELKTKVNEGKIEDLNEGLFGALVGGVAGMTVLPTIMKGLCSVLGVDLKGILGTTLTSRLVLTTLCARIGWKK
jgi:hypothetical protein